MNEVPPEFLQNHRVKKLFDVLDSGHSPMLRIVGGAVRNHMLGKPIADIDFATIWTPEQVIDKCKKDNVKIIPTGIDHGTVTAVIDGQNFEITTLRRDVETDGRRAVVAFSKSWEEDAKRRDFTMNALYMDKAGKVFDPLGEGCSDINSKHVKFIGNADNRIKEDALRILRFYRFSLYYGADIDKDGLRTCLKHADLIKILSVERITQELLNVFNYKGEPNKFVDIVQAMSDNNIFSMLDSSISNTHLGISKIKQVFRIQKQYDLYNKNTMLFCVLGIGKSLRLSNKQSKFLQSLDGAIKDNAINVKHLLYKYGREVTTQSLLFKDSITEGDIELSKSWSIPELPIQGKDILDAGIKAGPEVGALLSSIEDWWIAQDFNPDRDACLKRLDIKAT